MSTRVVSAGAISAHFVRYELLGLAIVSEEA